MRRPLLLSILYVGLLSFTAGEPCLAQTPAAKPAPQVK